ncbi:MAG: glutamate--tRNA ligase [Clostridiales bacterium]|jgi:glutamyl-tRNA synthetase|nr:glutamate--tRNA ligase [Clostridiales bacterium]
MDTAALAALLFSHITASPADMEARFPRRTLPDGARVTRIAPSPTGFLHIGALFSALTDERLAHLSGGVFYLRIEDTDRKREVPGAVEAYIRNFDRYGLTFDEGVTIDGDTGSYGPYRQSQRTEIYQTFAKWLVEQGRAYPCFCTEDELNAMREQQETEKITPGYYGTWAVWRDADETAVREKLAVGVPYVIRFKSLGDPERRIKFTDQIKGALEFPENDQDIVLLKSDGIPTYHFAHVVDDHLMGTTHVVRGEEWLASLPVHLEIFRAMGWKPPKFCHTATIMKLDGSSKRKISKRKDPEADLEWYSREGYPPESVREYVMTLLNSNFEDWRRDHAAEDLTAFPFSLNKMSVSGALFDLQKLADVSKNVVCRMSAAQVYQSAAAWAKEYSPDFHALLTRDPAYSTAILNIGREDPKPRRDYGVWSELPAYMSFFFDETFTPGGEYPANLTADDHRAILTRFLETYCADDDVNAWFDKLKAIAAELGLAPDTKTFRKNPGAYRGHVGDVSMVLRVAVTGRNNAPDLYSVMRILGAERTLARVRAAL